MWHKYINATSIDEVLQTLSECGVHARIVAGGTDLLLELERGARQHVGTLIDVTRIPGLNQITMGEDGMIHLGPLVTHNDCAASPLLRKHGLPLALAAWQVGAPQIRNRATVAGNIITASPANDTISPLMALGAQITLRSAGGTRVVPFAEFYAGFRQTVMEPDEILVDIAFPALGPDQRGMFVKLALRQAQAISLVNVAMVVSFGSPSQGTEERVVEKAALTLGAVTPVIVHAEEAEAYLTGRVLTQATAEETARLAQKSAKPIDDVRGSADYRMEMVRVGTLHGLRTILAGQEQAGIPAAPVLLRGQKNGRGAHPQAGSTTFTPHSPIKATVNGREVATTGGHDKTLLDWLRDDAGLKGAKEGCAEGECGACTVHLDGQAVMACLVPAPRAHGAEVATVEGLRQNGELHPLQQAFIDEGAVQCGYCTPGLLMSAAKLLEERPQPTANEMQQAITGNLCRCTGYYKILKAMEAAARRHI